MKRLMNPKWALLLEKSTREERGDVFWAVLHYPNIDCDHSAWPYIKSELDEDEEKYRIKCDRLAANRTVRWTGQTPSDINQNSTDFRQRPSDINMKSGAIASSIEHNQNNKTRAMDALIDKFAGNFNPNRPVKFLIDQDFSITNIIEHTPGLSEIFKHIPSDKVMAGEESLREKCWGKEWTIKQIVGWIENEGNFKNSSRI